MTPLPLLPGTGTQRSLLTMMAARSLGPELCASLNPVAAQSLSPASADTIVSKSASDWPPSSPFLKPQLTGMAKGANWLGLGSEQWPRQADKRAVPSRARDPHKYPVNDRESPCCLGQGRADPQRPGERWRRPRQSSRSQGDPRDWSVLSGVPRRTGAAPWEPGGGDSSGLRWEP